MLIPAVASLRETAPPTSENKDTVKRGEKRHTIRMRDINFSLIIFF